MDIIGIALIFIILAVIAVLILFFKNLFNPATATVNGTEPFQLIAKRQYEYSTYFSYKINRKYKKLGDRLDVMGISRRRDEADAFYYAKKRALTLEREPANPKDSNAIKVLGNGHMLGYVPRQLAAELACLMDKGIPLLARLEGLMEPNDNYCAKIIFSIWMNKDALIDEKIPSAL